MQFNQLPKYELSEAGYLGYQPVTYPYDITDSKEIGWLMTAAKHLTRDHIDAALVVIEANKYELWRK